MTVASRAALALVTASVMLVGVPGPLTAQEITKRKPLVIGTSSATRKPSVTADAAPRAVSFGWGGRVDTDLPIRDFFASDFTLMLWFLPEFPYAYAGPIITTSNGDSAATFSFGQGDYHWEEKKLEFGEAGEPKLYLAVQGQRRVYKVGSKLRKAKVPNPVWASHPSSKSKYGEIAALDWQHAAIVRKNGAFRVYLNGELLADKDGQAPPTANVTYPSTVRLRLGRSTAIGGIDPFLTYEGQFYGLLDDVAIFKRALSSSEIDDYLAAHGNVSPARDTKDLLALWTFDDAHDRPVTFAERARRVSVSRARQGALDRKQFDRAKPQVTMQLPFPAGEAWWVTQGYDDPAVSHKGFASFCLDFARTDGKTKGAPFLASAPGTIVKLDDAQPDSTKDVPANFVAVRQAKGEYAVYMHHQKGSFAKTYRSIAPLVNNAKASAAGTSPGSTSKMSAKTVAAGQKIALTGDSGAEPGAYHLHLAVSNRIVSNGFATFPVAFTNYEVSYDEGKSWSKVAIGTPKAGEWVRRPK